MSGLIHRPAGIANPLGVASGGTGAASFTAGAVLLGNSTGAIQTDAGLVFDTATDKLTVGGDVQIGVSGRIDRGTERLATRVGTGNLFLGASGNLTLSGSNNIAIGTSTTADAITTGSGNVSIGHEALGNVTTGQNNMGIGSGALLGLTGSNCVGIGLDAGRQAGGVNGLVAIGVSAAYNGGGTDCVGIGQVSCGGSGGNGTNFGSVAVGPGAMQAIQGVTGAVGIGYQSGVAVTTGHYNVCIGYQSGTTITTGAGNVTVGQGANVSTAAAANRIVIGQTASGDTNNQVFLGNSSVIAWVPGAADVATLGRSDREFQGLYLANGVNAVAGTSATINAATGRFRVSASATAFTLTNSRIAAGDTVICLAVQNDATGRVINAVPAAGSVVINVVAPTADMDCQFLVVKN